jgi:YHYH protein
MATTNKTSTPIATVPSTVPSRGSGVASWSGTPISANAIPVGDGRVSPTPKVGYVDSCTTAFNGHGPTGVEPWIDTSAGTWDSTRKLHVQGANTWPNPSHSFSTSGSERVLETNHLPSGATTGNFPIASSDPAYQYDKNPNHVSTQSFSWTVPTDPSAAGSPGCLGLGPIGVSTDGVVFFDGLDASGHDAGAHELQDSCACHPQEQGVYHYHTYSPCLGASEQAGSSTLVGYALDGYGIYVERDRNGHLPSDADLDACHGRTSRVIRDGKSIVMYHYDVTMEYPYTLGCYHGTPAKGLP